MAVRSPDAPPGSHSSCLLRGSSLVCLSGAGEASAVLSIIPRSRGVSCGRSSRRLPVLFSGTSLGRGMFEQMLGRHGFSWSHSVLTLVMAWLPAYADRRDIATLDGDISRYTGLALLMLGCILRVGPMFELGPRFRPPWVKQEDHRLVTTGFYRYRSESQLSWGRFSG